MKFTWVRVVLVVSLDGRLAFPNDGKQHLGEQGDKAILEEALAWADATLVGSNTIKIHQKLCLIKRSELISKRHL